MQFTSQLGWHDWLTRNPQLDMDNTTAYTIEKVVVGQNRIKRCSAADPISLKCCMSQISAVASGVFLAKDATELIVIKNMIPLHHKVPKNAVFKENFP